MEKGKIMGNDVCLQGGNHNACSQDESRGHWANMLMQDSISRPSRLHWAVKKVGNDLRSTQNTTRWVSVSARRCIDCDCRNVTWHRKDSSLARYAGDKQSGIGDDPSAES